MGLLRAKDTTMLIDFLGVKWHENHDDDNNFIKFCKAMFVKMY